MEKKTRPSSWISVMSRWFSVGQVRLAPSLVAGSAGERHVAEAADRQPDRRAQLEVVALLAPRAQVAGERGVVGDPARVRRRVRAPGATTHTFSDQKLRLKLRPVPAQVDPVPVVLLVLHV